MNNKLDINHKYVLLETARNNRFKTVFTWSYSTVITYPYPAVKAVIAESKLIKVMYE